MKVKEPETISSVLGQIKREEKRTEELSKPANEDFSIQMDFKSRQEKIVWLADELRKELERAFNEKTSKRHQERAKQ